MIPLPHTAARSRTIPARIWRGMASLNDSAGLTEIDWRHLLVTVLWMLRLALFAGAISTYLDGHWSKTFIALVTIVAINTLPGKPHVPAARGDI